MHSPRTIERAGAVDSRMRTRPSSLTPTAALGGIWGLLLLAFVVAALYFGRSVLVPIALATLVTFLLSRLVTRLERWIGRIAAVLVTVIAMFTIFAAASWVIGRQVIDLADKLPDYQANIATQNPVTETSCCWPTGAIFIQCSRSARRAGGSKPGFVHRANSGR